MLHLNLSKLAEDADTFREQTNQLHRLLIKLEWLDSGEAKELSQLIEEGQKNAPDAFRLNGFAKMCS